MEVKKKEEVKKKKEAEDLEVPSLSLEMKRAFASMFETNYADIIPILVVFLPHASHLAELVVRFLPPRVCINWPTTTGCQKLL